MNSGKRKSYSNSNSSKTHNSKKYPPSKQNSAKRGSHNGTGYAGDARSDAAKRKKLQKLVHANEADTVQLYMATLQSALDSLSSTLSTTTTSTTSTSSDEWMNILKSVLRNQADWLSPSGHPLYQLALDCCERIIQHFPLQLGKEDDSESLLYALLEMVSTAEIVSTHTQEYSVSGQRLAQQVLEMKDRAIRASRIVVQREDLLLVDNHAHYRQMLRPFAFDFVDDLPGHYFLCSRNKFASLTSNHTTATTITSRQRQHIMRELGTYQTALPVDYGSSVYVRAMEGRMDLLRCLIIGPDGSPYACGCFFFDISLQNYPDSPPRVQFLTTGGGRYRFNPNLYNDGKVCLSLLGTWQGPGWQAGESTLLQVLVSIQSLILVEEPYFNEPGFQCSLGTASGTRASDQYNSNIRRYTMDAAILPHLKRIANPTQVSSHYPEFDDIIEKHFTLKEHAWKKQLSQWRQEATRDKTKQKNNSYAYDSFTAIPGIPPANSCRDMETLYNECIAAWEQRPRKQKARKNHCNKIHGNASQSAVASSPTSSSHSISGVNAVEVDGVIEIDLEPNMVDPPAVARAASTTEDTIIDLTL